MIKNSLISLQKGFLALMSATLLFSCSQIDSFEAEDMFVLRSSAIVQEACYTGEVSSAVTFNGAYQNKQTVGLNVRNDQDFVYLDFSSSTTILFINGVKVNVKAGMAHSVVMTHAEFLANPIFEVRRTGEGHGACAPGNCLVVDASQYQIIEPCDSCVEGLTYTREGNEVIFTLIPDENNEKGTVSMTLAQADDYTVLDGKKWNTQGNNTIVWNGPLVECQPVSFKLAFEGDCGANLVTNFRVKGEGNLLKDKIAGACL